MHPGQSCRYLGFQIGIDISPTQQFALVLASIRKKLTHAHLSLVGRALVVNHVLFATTWYTVSCWMLHSKVLSQLRRPLHNFLWAGSDDTRDTTSRVAEFLPRSQGGLGIIDPEIRSRALLATLLISGLFPWDKPWKLFLRSALFDCMPRYGGNL